MHGQTCRTPETSSAWMLSPFTADRVSPLTPRRGSSYNSLLLPPTAHHHSVATLHRHQHLLPSSLSPARSPVSSAPPLPHHSPAPPPYMPCAVHSTATLSTLIATSFSAKRGSTPCGASSCIMRSQAGRGPSRAVALLAGLVLDGHDDVLLHCRHRHHPPHLRLHDLAVLVAGVAARVG